MRLIALILVTILSAQCFGQQTFQTESLKQAYQKSKPINSQKLNTEKQARLASENYKYERINVQNNTTSLRKKEDKKRINLKNTKGSVTDINGNTYNTVIIGNQEWMAENLKATSFPNGNAINLVTDNTAWDTLPNSNTDAAYCYYNNDSGSESSTYGALYTYAAALNVCPTDWHLPSENEWQILENYISTNGYSGSEGSALKSTSGWFSEGNGVDAFGFAGLPGGARSSYGGEFIDLTEQGGWWTTTESEDLIKVPVLRYDNSSIYYHSDFKSTGFSVRCLKDSIVDLSIIGISSATEGCLLSSAEIINVDFLNNGTLDFNHTFDLSVSVNGVILTEQVTIEGLQPDSITTIQIGSWDMSAIQVYFIESNHNFSDNNTGNNSFSTYRSTGDAIISVELFTDAYPGETTWSLTDAEGNVLALNGALEAETLHTTDICAPAAGCYTFTILDSYGDGIGGWNGSPAGYLKVYFNGELVNEITEANANFGEETLILGIGEGCPADEIVLSQLTIAPSAPINTGVEVKGKVMNFGTDVLSAVDVTYNIDGGGDVAVYTVSGLNAATGEVAEFAHNVPASFATAGTYTINVTVSNPNGNADNEADNTASAEVMIYEGGTQRTVLVEEFSTEQCPNCPPVATYLAEIAHDNDNVILMVHHAGYYTDDYTIPENEELLVFYNDGGSTYAPAGMVDRHYNGLDNDESGGVDPGPVFWPGSPHGETRINDRLSQPAFVDLNFSKIFNEATRELNITVSGTFLNDFTDNLGISLWIIEDGITTSAQAGYDGEWTHYSVVRDAITPTFGDPISTTTNTNDTYTASYTYTIAQDWVAENLTVVGFINTIDASDVNNKTVHNAASIAVVSPDQMIYPIPFTEDFESISPDDDLALADWTNFTEVGTRKWIGKEYNDNKYAQMSSYASGEANTSWLISPAINLDATENEIFSFDVNIGYFTHEGLTVYLSTDFDGTDVSSATWQDITTQFTIPTEPTSGYGTFVTAGAMDLSSYAGNVNIAFKYEGDDNNSQTTTYQIDNFKVESHTAAILTFNVAMSEVSSFDAANDTVWVTGNFTGWDEPGSGGSIQLTDDDSDLIYTASIELDLNYGEVQYKYFIGSGWDNGEWGGDPNRIIYVATNDIVTNDIFGKVPGESEVIFTENFDAFNADDYLVLQANNPNLWTTWSNAPGTAEDPFISTNFAASTPNSVKIDGTNDAVFVVGNLTEGRYLVEMDLYIPDSTLAYYNMLQEFAGGDSKWGYQISFIDGNAIVDGGLVDANFSYDYNTWMHMSTRIDLNADWCEIYFDEVKVHEFKWSYGTSATYTNTFEAINFYAWNNNGEGTPEYYFDNLQITELPYLPAPTYFTAVVENSNDVQMNWDIPVGLTPDSYSIYRDGILISEGITELSYTDYHVYPKEYEYAVKAVYNGLGISPDAAAGVTIYGGIARKTVLFESIVSTSSEFSPSKQKAFDLLNENGQDVSVIQYNFNDEFNTYEASYRLFNYYGVTSWLQTWVDGTTELISYTEGGDEYASYKPAYDEAINVPSVVDLNMEINQNTETTFDLSVTVTEAYAYYESGLKLHVALVENNIPYDWLDMNEVNYVLRDLITDTLGYNVDLSSGSQIFDFSLEIDPSYNIANCKVITFIQHDESKFVVQAMNKNLPVIPNIEITTIYNIQYVAEGNDSPELGNEVLTKGVVVAKDNYGFYLQDGAGAWNGIYVYNANVDVNVADSVLVFGEVSEYNNLTEIYQPIVEIINNGNSISSPVEVYSLAEFNSEMYEGVLTSIITNMNAASELNGLNWSVTDGEDTVTVRNTMVEYTPFINQNFTSITGLGGQYYEIYQIYPRSVEDIVSGDLFEVTFNVRTSDGSEPIPYATVEFQGATEQTNNMGKAYFEAIAPGSNMPYTVTKSGYEIYEGTVTVVNQDVTEEVRMEIDYPEYTVLFSVKDSDDSSPIVNAIVNFEGNAKYTDASGEATFENVTAGSNLQYSVVKTGYDTFTGSIANLSDNLMVNVFLHPEAELFDLIINTANNTSSIGNVDYTINPGGISGTSGSNGMIGPFAVEAGTYHYSLSKSGYFYVSNSVTVNTTTTENVSYSILGDFNADNSLTLSDLDVFIDKWRNNESSYELGPASGLAPNYDVQPDGKFDFEDLMIFGFMWDNFNKKKSAEIPLANVDAMHGNLTICATKTTEESSYRFAINGHESVKSLSLKVAYDHTQLQYNGHRLLLDPTINLISYPTIMNDSGFFEINLGLLDESMNISELLQLDFIKLSDQTSAPSAWYQIHSNETQSWGMVSIMKSQPQIAVYPNPVTNTLYVSTNSANYVKSIKVFDVSGKCLHTQNQAALTSEITFTEYDSGLYIVIIETQDDKIFEKIFKN